MQIFGLKSWKIKRFIKKLKAMQQYRIHNQPKDEILKKESNYWLALASLYQKSIGDKKHPFAEIHMLESYRNAADLGNTEAQYLAGRYLLDEAKCREQGQKEGLFNSAANEQLKAICYQEAHQLLSEAEKFGHILAQRLHGLSLINGWGTETDMEKGFDLIAASIDKENSWDKVPQLFAEMQLNKPEFFAAAMKRRTK